MLHKLSWTAPEQSAGSKNLIFTDSYFIKRRPLFRFSCVYDMIFIFIKVHIFWEGHKNMTKSPNFFWQNGLLSKVGCNWGHGLSAAAHFFKKSKIFEKNLLRRPFCQKKVWRFRHIFVAFSEYMNFNKVDFLF